MLYFVCVRRTYRRVGEYWNDKLFVVRASRRECDSSWVCVLLLLLLLLLCCINLCMKFLTVSALVFYVLSPSRGTQFQIFGAIKTEGRER